MKTFAQYTLSALMLLSSLEAAHSAPATSLNLEMTKARDFAEEAQEIRRRKMIMGSFARDQRGNGDIFDAYDAALEKLMGRDFVAVRVLARADEVKVQVKDTEVGRIFWVSSIVARPARDAKPVVRQRFQENLTLTVETVTQWTNTASGRFVSLTETSESKSLSAGRTYGIFTLSVFGKLTGQDWNLGAKAQANFDLGKGFKLGVTAQVAQASRSVLNVTEGRYERRFDRNASASARVQIDKTWTLKGLRSSAGMQFSWAGGADFSSKPGIYGFLSLGRDFKNARGEKIASLDFMAMKQLGMRDGGWMLGIMGSFVF